MAEVGGGTCTNLLYFSFPGFTFSPLSVFLHFCSCNPHSFVPFFLFCTTSRCLHFFHYFRLHELLPLSFSFLYTFKYSVLILLSFLLNSLITLNHLSVAPLLGCAVHQALFHLSFHYSVSINLCQPMLFRLPTGSPVFCGIMGQVGYAVKIVFLVIR